MCPYGSVYMMIAGLISDTAYRKSAFRNAQFVNVRTHNWGFR